jgi:molybdopterin synthase sulfur carrier subunit
VKLRFFATYRDITKSKEIDIPAPPDVWTLLVNLGERYGVSFKKEAFTPDESELSENVIILVNGRNIFHLEHKSTPLAETDIVSIFPLIAGG